MNFTINVACVAGAKRGGRGGGRKAPYPTLLPFFLFPYPLPLSKPATQATINGGKKHVLACF